MSRTFPRAMSAASLTLARLSAAEVDSGGPDLPGCACILHFAGAVLTTGSFRPSPMALHLRAQGMTPPRPAAAISLLIALATLLVLAAPAGAARTIFFADPGADAIVQYSVGVGGALSPLVPPSVHADDPRRLAMTRGGT